MNRWTRTPIAAVASAGRIVTGSVDPIAEIIEVTRAEDLWVHVQGVRLPGGGHGRA
jgi:glutamate/tyrosine decarboxylase-like PLP-dependent enzyme